MRIGEIFDLDRGELRVPEPAGAILGACHGYEALPSHWLGRLELGWVMDRLARDLAAKVAVHQAGRCWKEEGPSGPRAVDPWWDAKYPGV